MEGFYVTDGLKYGADMLLYTDDPSKVHSKYAILIENNQTNGSVLAVQRICNSVGKILIFVRFNGDDYEMYRIQRLK